MRAIVRLFTGVVLAILFSDGALAQNLSDAELAAKIEAANPGISKKERNFILACHKYSVVCQELDKDYKGLKPGQVTAYLRNNRQMFEAQAEEYTSGRRPIPSLPPKPKETPKDPIAPKVESYFLVRRALEDISSLSRPRDPKDVTGAIFSYSRDNVTPNNVWSARGVVATPFYITEYTDPTDRYAIGKRYAIAPFVSFDKVSNSSASLAKTNLNNLTFGLISEAAITNVGRELPVDHYFRLNGGANMDFDGHFKSSYLRAEWEPFSTALGLNAPLDFLSVTRFNISPLVKMRAEYLTKVGSISQPIFSARDEVFRVGPRVGVEIQPVTGLWPDWFNSFTLVAAYGYYYDTLSKRSYSLFDSALNYNIDEAGNYALSATYRRGRLEETGDKVDQYMVGLSIKLNELPTVSKSSLP
jgi:hypothetical protein